MMKGIAGWSGGSSGSSIAICADLSGAPLQIAHNSDFFARSRGTQCTQKLEHSLCAECPASEASCRLQRQQFFLSASRQDARQWPRAVFHC